MAGRLIVSTLNDDTGVLATQNGMTGICKAWCQYNSVTQSIIGSYNISSVTYIAQGVTRFNFTTSMPNNGYATVLGVARDSGTGFSFAGYLDNQEAQTTSSVRTVTGAVSGGLNTARVCVAVFV